MTSTTPTTSPWMAPNARATTEYHQYRHRWMPPCDDHPACHTDCARDAMELGTFVRALVTAATFVVLVAMAVALTIALVSLILWATLRFTWWVL